MTEDNKSINSHIEEYLDYYCGLSQAPGFAILLKGQWGAGKTWFIKKYQEKLKQNNQKCLYVSLYGMTSFSEIEDMFFQQLHPVLSSKGMAITGKIFKGLLKGTLKIDLDNDDKKDDGTWTLGIPDINFPEYLKDTDKSILIFDDLERCQIDIGNLLGYINSFVEHQDLKVVLVANEDELLKRNGESDSSSLYKDIKEKLIGRTFEIFPDFQGALEDFITKVDDSHLKDFLQNNNEIIQELYAAGEYRNLRNLNQIILDFQRIYQELPEKAKNKSELLQDILKILTAFSIEINRGNMLAKDISKLLEASVYQKIKGVNLYQVKHSAVKDKTKEEILLQKIIDRYPMLKLNIYEPFPSLEWWEIFFDQGIVDIEKLDKLLSNSKYFENENTPNWVRLWRFTSLDDDEFYNLLQTVESEYAGRKFIKLGEIKHVFGIFLRFSDAGFYSKSKTEILKESKNYIHDLTQNKKIDITCSYDFSSDDILGSYAGLVYQGTEFPEFQEFCSYVEQVTEQAKIENLPNEAQELLNIIQSDVWKFERIICRSNSHSGDISENRYYDIPILNYIEAPIFVEKLLSMKFEQQITVCWILTERYKYDDCNQTITEELDWLKSVQNLLLEEANRKTGKLSGFKILKFLIEPYLNKAIKKLETARTK
ncbi:MAG: P-loop NTPase fold protein [Nostocaceae cyanobacterium]|nr:P-loop NTPase fold protein [Nostocaceae cyanobacterium]